MIFNYISSFISKIFSHEKTKKTEYVSENIGKKAKLVRDYPLRVACITKGNEYEILDATIVRKAVTRNADIDFEIWQIENDNNVKIWVSICYFEI
jgi:hypothetical protein